MGEEITRLFERKPDRTPPARAHIRPNREKKHLSPFHREGRRQDEKSEMFAQRGKPGECLSAAGLEREILQITVSRGTVIGERDGIHDLIVCAFRRETETCHDAVIPVRDSLQEGKEFSRHTPLLCPRRSAHWSIDAAFKRYDRITGIDAAG
jgi:hypothetical protein